MGAIGPERQSRAFFKELQLNLKENEKSEIMAPETAKRTAFEKPSRKASQRE